MYTVAVFIYLIIYSNPAFGFEPDCSRFHYEEKTLEKMIRQEVAVEKMRAEMEDMKHKMIKSLADMKHERNKITVDFEKKANDIDAMKDGLDKAFANMKAQNGENMEAFSKDIEHMKAAAMTHLIAFRAKHVLDTSVADNKVIVFTENELSIGDAYNNQTGIFVAPVRGMYIFTAQICMHGSEFASFGIFVEDRVISKISIGNDKRAICSSFDAIAEVDQREQVSIKCSYGCDSSDNVWDNANYLRNAFSGFLMRSL